MKVSELIVALSGMPQDADVGIIYDGGERLSCESIYLARSGRVLLTDSGEVVYGTEDRPATAPTEKEDRYWRTPYPEDTPQ